VKKRSGLYPRVGVDAAGSGVVSQAGGVTLVEALRVSGLDAALSQALAPWRRRSRRTTGRNAPVPLVRGYATASSSLSMSTAASSASSPIAAEFDNSDPSGCSGRSVRSMCAAGA
jgi:hypothetical protein